jgi:hypothetical protein
MSDETIDKTLKEFLESVTTVLRGHAESLKKLTEAVEQMQKNQSIEHLNVAEIGAMVNSHTAILSALDAEVRRRMGEPPLESPREPVN